MDFFNFIMFYCTVLTLTLDNIEYTIMSGQSGTLPGHCKIKTSGAKVAKQSTYTWTGQNTTITNKPMLKVDIL